MWKQETVTRRRCRQQRRWVEDGRDEIDDDDEGHNAGPTLLFKNSVQMSTSFSVRLLAWRCCPAGRGDDARGCAAGQQHPCRRLGASTVVITTFPQRANQSQLRRVETCGDDDDDDDHDNDHDDDHDDRDHADDCLCDRKN